MTRKEQIARRLIEANRGRIYISTNAACKTLGRGRESFARMMNGYDYRIAGRNHAKQYLVDDIADAEVKKGGQS